MEQKVTINDLDYNLIQLDISDFNHQVTNKVLKKIILSLSLIGNIKQKELDNILKKSFQLKIPSENINIRAKSVFNSWSYNNTDLNNETLINYNIEIEEIDKDLPEDWNSLVAFGQSIIYNWIRTRALSELLSEKGIIS